MIINEYNLNRNKSKGEERRVREHSVFLDEDTHFSYNQEGIQMGVHGQTGTGKTTTSLLASSQFPSCLFFDPQNRAKKTVGEIGEKENWMLSEITERKNGFRINASDIHQRIGNFLCYKSSNRDKTAQKVIDKFVNLPREEKTYDKLYKMFVKARTEEYFDDLKIIIDENDRGQNLRELQSNKKIIFNISEISTKSMAVGAIIGTIVGHRTDEYYACTPLLIAIDECQSYAEGRTTTGKAFDECSGRGRRLHISTLVSGLTIAPLGSITKNQLRYLVLHRITYEIDTFWKKFHIVSDIDIDELPDEKGYAWYCDVWKHEKKMIRPSTYYQSLVREKKVKALETKEVERCRVLNRIRV